MRKTFRAGALSALLAACALFAAGSSAGVTQNTNSGDTNANAHAGHSTAGMNQDSKFAFEAAMGGLMEVEAGRLAAQKGASEDVRQFGRRMVDDHTKANGELMKLASGKGIRLPTALGPKHQQHASKLSALSGERFDREYVKMMIRDHKKTGDLFQREAARGADADLKAFAARTLPVVREHQRLAQRIYDKMLLRRNNPNPAHNSNPNARSR